ncbi:ribulose-phosphate 3-epimerase [Candidatus Peregrinibacteria bacterium]|nr:MAG: ribulose-phosphate 3-epimerase [Candidatus Peregrinibacteria bacterium]
MRNIHISPSLLSANFGHLQSDINRAEPFVDGFHFDVMDGHFVPNLTAGAPVLSCLHSKKPFDVHLMVSNPDNLLEDFAKSGASSLCVHTEVCPHIHRTLQCIREIGMRAGVVLNPATSFDFAKEAIAIADYVLIMSVNPGFSGQDFLPEVLPKVREIRERFPEKDIQIDGGIRKETIQQVLNAGANWIVSGSFFWKSENLEKATQILRGERLQYSGNPF